MEVSEVRRRLRAAIERARRDAAVRRQHADTAAREFEAFLSQVAVPIFHTLANALVAEGHRFQVFTPAGSVRLASERSGEDFVELALDASPESPVILLRTSRGRGRGQITSERSIAPASGISSLTDSDVLQFVLDEIGRFVER
jgi:hypothetical protein